MTLDKESILWRDLIIEDLLPERFLKKGVSAVPNENALAVVPVEPDPKISLIVPFFGQGSFLAGSLESIVSQQYSALELIVVDCGSESDQGELRARYAKDIAKWERIEGKGYYFAINEAFKLATGEVMSWIPVGVKLAPGALKTAGKVFQLRPEVLFLGGHLPFNMGGDATLSEHRWTRNSHLNLENLNRLGYTISELMPFWRRSLWTAAGGTLDLSYKVAQDFELWARFLRLTQLHNVEHPFSIPAQPQREPEPPSGTYLTECMRIIGREHAIAAVNPTLDDVAPQVIKLAG